jgi:shikimate dehydrogenase
MAKMTMLVASQLGMSLVQLSRRSNPDLASLDLIPFRKISHQNIVINACSRDFVFAGNLGSDDIFWDYNYSFLPHQNTLPSRVKLYQDGQEMLELQAKAAIQFWNQTTSKLK